MFIAGRIVQGIGAAAIIPLCLSILIERIASENQGQGIGRGNSFGPLAGGFLIGVFGWRSIYIPSAIITISAICVCLRMFLLSGIAFLIPLFLTDALAYTAAKTGALLTIHSATLLIALRLSGVMADRLSSRYPVIIGLTLQALSFGAIALRSGSANTALVVIALAVNGAGSGLYTMIRFTGGLFASAVAGIVLQRGIAAFSATGAAYRSSFIVLTAASAEGALLSILLKEVAKGENA